MVASHAMSAPSGYNVDPVRELGLELEQKQYNTRLLALTKPDAYAKERQKEFNKMVAAVTKAYSTSYKGFTDAGMPHEMAKSYALASANTAKQVRRQILETLYPSGANIIGNMATVRDSETSVAHLQGLGGGMAPPARRRAAPRRRR